MVAFNPVSVAKIVQDQLARASVETKRVRVVAEQVRKEDGGWWYVPVSYQEDPHSMYAYYEAFSKVEDELKRTQDLDILLVPRMTPWVDPNLA